LARDPEGTSRLPRETFQQVFDRMEKDLNGKQFPWSTIVEYFTKRGKPLTKEEIIKLQEEDIRIKEEAKEAAKQEEEKERRMKQK